MIRSDYETITIEKPHDYVMVVSFNRPQAANAMNTRLALELREIFDEIYVDADGVRCVVLTGRGSKAFCAGADLKERKSMCEADWRCQHAVFEQLALSLRACPVPLIAAVNGAAYGGGCEIALGADFIYAARNARFALTETTLGIMPGMMGTQNLPLAVGERRARELIFTGKPFNAVQALEWGLVNRVCESDMLIQETVETARTISANAPLAIRHAKRAVAVATEVDRQTGYRFELEAYNNLVGTEDQREGVLAFNEKRKPEFRGQ